MSDNTNVLEIKTIQIPPFRTLMTALKDILLETNIIFQQDGIRIVNMDKSHTILAHLFLQADKFEYYFCKYPKIVIGVNMFQLFKLINSIDNDDTLTIYIEENDYNDGIVDHLGLKFENGDIKQSKIQKLRLIEPDNEARLNLVANKASIKSDISHIKSGSNWWELSPNFPVALLVNHSPKRNTWTFTGPLPIGRTKGIG